MAAGGVRCSAARRARRSARRRGRCVCPRTEEGQEGAGRRLLKRPPPAAAPARTHSQRSGPPACLAPRAAAADCAHARAPVSDSAAGPCVPSARPSGRLGGSKRGYVFVRAVCGVQDLEQRQWQRDGVAPVVAQREPVVCEERRAYSNADMSTFLVVNGPRRQVRQGAQRLRRHRALQLGPPPYWCGGRRVPLRTAHQGTSRSFSCCQQRECTVGTWVGATVGRGGLHQGTIRS